MFCVVLTSVGVEMQDLRYRRLYVIQNYCNLMDVKYVCFNNQCYMLRQHERSVPLDESPGCMNIYKLMNISFLVH